MTQAEIDEQLATMTRAEAQDRLAEIARTANSQSLGAQIESSLLFQGWFYGKKLKDLDAIEKEKDREETKKQILDGLSEKLQPILKAAEQRKIPVLIGGTRTYDTSALYGSSLESLHGVVVEVEPSYVRSLQNIANGVPQAAATQGATPIIRTAPVAIPVVQATPSQEPRQTVIPTALPVRTTVPSAVPTSMPSARTDGMEVVTAREEETIVQRTATGTTIVTARQVQTLSTPTRAATQAPALATLRPTNAAPIPTRAAAPSQTPSQTPSAAAPFSMGRITPQTTVLDLIVNGIHNATDGDAAQFKTVATARLTDELKKSKPELANNPQALEAAVRQGLPNSIRSLLLELSKDKTVQQKIANGFLDGMRRESPGAENSGFYKHLKTLASDERTFNSFLNTNMLDGITRDYEARVRAENNGQVPRRVLDAVAANIMRIKPEIKKYNDQVGQNINDFVRNPEISRQRLLHSPRTQAEIRAGLAQYKKDHPFQTFFAGLFGINMEQRAQEEAAKRIAREVKDKNYSREIQTGFVNEINRRTEGELRGEQLANMRNFTRYLGHLPYSRFIQEDISPRRVSSIILGIEQPGEQHPPSRHVIPQQLISRTTSPYVNVASAPTQTPHTQPHGAPSRAPSPQSAA